MTGPTNAVMGDADSPMNLPSTEVPEEILLEEKKLAAYSKTAEFQRLREFMENRIKFYQTYLPDGREVDKVLLDPETTSSYWMAANIVIREYNNILAEYDRAKESVDGRS